MTTTYQMCPASNRKFPSGVKWNCTRPKGHDGLHDDGLGDQWADEADQPDAVDRAILRGLINRRVEVEGPDFDQADESLAGYAKAVRAALLDGAEVREEWGTRLAWPGGKVEDRWCYRDKTDAAAQVGWFAETIPHAVPGGSLYGATVTLLRRLHLTLAAEAVGPESTPTESAALIAAIDKHTEGSGR